MRVNQKHRALKKPQGLFGGGVAGWVRPCWISVVFNMAATHSHVGALILPFAAGAAMSQARPGARRGSHEHFFSDPLCSFVGVYGYGSK